MDLCSDNFYVAVGARGFSIRILLFVRSPQKYVCKYIKIVLAPNHLSMIYNSATKYSAMEISQKFYMVKSIQTFLIMTKLSTISIQ